MQNIILHIFMQLHKLSLQAMRSSERGPRARVARFRAASTRLGQDSGGPNDIRLRHDGSVGNRERNPERRQLQSCSLTIEAMALESLEVVSATSVNASSNGRSGQGWTAFGPGPEIRMNERILFLTARY